MTLSGLSRVGSPPALGAQFGAKNYSVLAADDSSIARKIMQHAVDQYNAQQEHTDGSKNVKLELTLAESRPQAEQLLKTKPVDILITDNSMPQADEGIALSKFATTLPKKPFIAMLSSDNIEDKAKEAGVQAYFHKNNLISKMLQTVVERFQQSKKTLKKQQSCAGQNSTSAHSMLSTARVLMA